MLRSDVLGVARKVEDLYALLGLSAGAPAAQLRKAYEWAMQVERSPARRAEIQRAYAVLGDPRLRSEYDRGRTVGVGVQQLYQRPDATSTTGPLRERCDVVLVPECSPVSDRSRTWAAAMGLALTLVAAATYVRPLLTGAASSPTTATPAAAAQTVAAPFGLATGMCLSSEGDVISSSQAVDCSLPHKFEVIKVIDLDRLLGRSFTDPDRHAASQACTAEFHAFTGLADSAGDPFSAGVLDLAPAGAPGSYNICLVGSRKPRTGSAASLAR